MTTTSSTTRTTPKNMPQQAKDAIALLIDDHEHVKSLFEQYEDLGERALVTKKKLATQICTELTIHATVEEEIFYPAVRAAGGKEQDELVDEATVEHASAKDLIAQIMEMDAGEDLFDAKVKVLSELIEHHVKEEEEEMFPKARKDGLDLAALGQQMAERKAELT
jgi:iron-sulfur cluster repair protein YtfE (RIC family)